MPADGRASDARPASPFLILLLGGASCALGAEWLRFQWGAWLAVPPAVAGGVVTVASVARAYRARRRWRRRRALADEAARAVPSAPGDAASLGDAPTVVRAAPTRHLARPAVGRDEARDATVGTGAAPADRLGRPPLAKPAREPLGAARTAADPDAASGRDPGGDDRRRDRVGATRTRSDGDGRRRER